MPFALALFMIAASAQLIALMVSFSRGYLLLYGDAVAHLGIARRILDSRNPGLAQLGGVWLPLPHLLMLPFVQKMEWWQNGLAGAWPSLLCYIASVVGIYRLVASFAYAAVGNCGDGILCAEPQPALPRDHGHDGAALPRAGDLDDVLAVECVAAHSRRSSGASSPGAWL